jgi:hypothetical protein
MNGSKSVLDQMGLIQDHTPPHNIEQILFQLQAFIFGPFVATFSHAGMGSSCGVFL